MMNFESDLAPADRITVIPVGTPDMLDIWADENLPTDQDWADWLELTHDPDA